MAPNPDERQETQGLEERARKLAESQTATRTTGVVPTPLDRLAALERVLRETYARFIETSDERGTLSGVAEWLLDNYYVIQQAIRQIEQNMPAGYYRRLPKLDEPPAAGYPRIYAAAREMIQAMGGQVDVDSVKSFVRGYQEARPLTMGEIWALPTMLRISILELLTPVVARAAGVDIPVADERLPGLIELEDKVDEAIVAGAISSLRAIATEDWDGFFEAVSLVEETLRADPANVYSTMDFKTRDRYRGVVEELARAVDQSEREVAKAALAAARQEAGREAQGQRQQPDEGSGFGDRSQHVGFYLVGRGRDRLERDVGFRPGWMERAGRWASHHATGVYLSSITVIAALVVAGAVAYAADVGAGWGVLAAVAVLVLVPASIVGVSLVNAFLTRTIPPHVLPKLDFSDGIPRDYRTMVVIPALLTSDEEVDFLLQQLELHYLGNPEPELGFALLSDFSDAPEKHRPEDDELLERAKEGIRRLNREYSRGRAEDERAGAPFYLFHRERLWNPSEGCWMGWERKRGKLVEFNRLVRGEEETSYTVKMGDLDFLADVEYVITLDADTVFPLDTAHRLVGTLAHPLNRAEFDEEQVVAGYTVLQPRTEVKPTAVTKTRFTRLFAGDAGLDLYTRAVSDLYQDFFGEGVYIGKGIYDVDAFERSLRGRVPENALLSHDLFEGIHGRAALVSDITLFEDYPPTYLSYAHRKHRWVRGDWQILPWLFPRVPSAHEGTVANSLSALDRWKIFDNLRRSLRSPALFVLLVAAWLWMPGSPLIWTILAVLASGLPLVTGAATEIARRLRGEDQPRGMVELEEELGRWLLSLAFLPYETILMLDAIVATLVRLTISHKRLLQWTTAAHTVRIFGRESKIGLLWREMSAGPFLALIVTVLLTWLRPVVLPLAAPLLAAWLLSPQIAAWVSEPIEDRRASLSSRDRRCLRRLARRTWLYFESFVGPEDHWLPPDHFQEQPRGVVAHRTSPTNIGLMLLSTVSAWEMGHVGLLELMLRVSDAFDSMDELERYRGHLLNWYNTSDLSTLKPRYVSTVDSGNLAACLIALKQGLRELATEPLFRWERWRGLCDTVGVLREVVERAEDQREVAEEARAFGGYAKGLCERIAAARENPKRWIPLLVDLEEDVRGEFNRRLQSVLEAGTGVLEAATLRDLRLWSERIHAHLRELREEMSRLMPWMFAMDERPTILSGHVDGDVRRDLVEKVSSHGSWEALQATLKVVPRLGEVADICRTARTQLDDLISFLEDEAEALDETAEPALAELLNTALQWCRDLDDSLESARMTAGTLTIGLDDRVERAEGYVRDMDFGFLYDHQRDVFHIGYRVDAEQLDDNHYDLLASEARIASLVAVSKHDVPQRHWLHLNRPLTRVDGRRALLSWGGSMFEYLMPDLMMRDYDETLLNETNLAAVQRQINFGREKGVPWGISESGYYRLDAQMNYQYRGFGVPGLGRKRGLGDDLVIAPYASLLAVKMMPEEVLENLDRLIDEAMLGHYGLYEAVDYTDSRLPMGETKAIVRSYMAHHQGMIIIALSNYLDDRGIVDLFHRDPRVQAVEFLLQELVPRQSPLEEAPGETLGVEPPERERVALEPWSVPTDAPFPQVQVLSNGRYSTLITDAGAGYSAYVPGRRREQEPTALTRWRADTTLDCWGNWIYVQDRESGALWSVSQQPADARPDEEQVRFYPHRAEFRRRYGGISLHTEITVAPEDDLEIRRLTLTNHGDETRRLRVSSYAEVVLAPQDQDRRHPAFNKMFIESEYVRRLNALLFTRRPRSTAEEPLHMAHVLVAPPDMEPTRAYEGDRSRFIGRGRTTHAPAAFERSEKGREWLTGTVGATLDPIMALGQQVTMDAHTTAQLTYLTIAAETREEVVELASQYRAWPRISRAFEEAHAQSQVELGNLDLDVSDVRDMTQLLSVLLYPHRTVRADAQTLAANRLGQSGLWRYGISGDYPILLVRIGQEENAPLVRELLRAHAYWRDRQIKVDLVILNRKAAGYAQELSDQLSQVITQMDSEAWLNRRGGVFMVSASQMDEASRVLLETAARAVLDADEGSLHDQLRGLMEQPSPLPAFQPTGIAGEREPIPAVARPDDLHFDNGFGGFSADGREYVTYVESGSQAQMMNDWTPAPWINVIANPDFGFLVSNTGLGYSWAGNSGENRLTPWRNDPVSDLPAEVIYIRDEETGEIWSPTPMPAGEDAPYIVRHGAGYSVFEHNSYGLEQRLRVFAAADAPVKVVQLRLENTWDRQRRLTATFFAEWVLDVNRDQAQQYIIPEYEPETSALTARNPYSAEFGDRVAFVAASQELHGLTADRTEFLGRKGERRHPAALDRVGLASRVEPGLDPCAAAQIHIELKPGEAKEVFFLLGQGEDRADALELVKQYKNADQVAAAWEGVQAFWEGVLNTVVVDTPDPAMDRVLNGWLLYQALSCRIWGRSALYQSSGAYGFRDQLQDVMSLLHAAPEIAREHILRSARHQFEAGDVLHWWHPPSGRGVRTRISDDLLWLPFVTAEYVETTGDVGILDEEVPFRRGEPLDPEEEERYGHYGLTEERATVYEHCLRALDEGSTRGRSGLPLIGAGDWNDGLNRVGIEGEGESVWLGWFLHMVLTRFADVCERREDSDRADELRQRAAEYQEALEASAWDGEWYIRATYDDGTPLGSSENEECKIASMAQSWSVLSGAGASERREQAMAAVAERLVREDDERPPGLLLLFAPPFDETPHDPGYIRGYPPGIRENGGQYTHAALWAVWAYTEMGQGDRAGKLFQLLNPVCHSDTREKAERYRVEPYVVAADIYSADRYFGRGGWTWYTGSSGWMYRLGIEAILGLRREGARLRVDPCIPKDWQGYRMTYRYGETVYQIEVENPQGVSCSVRATTLDGDEVLDGGIPLRDDGGRHQVRVTMG